LYPEEVVPCLNAFSKIGTRSLCSPKGDEESRKIYLELAHMVQKAKVEESSWKKN